MNPKRITVYDIAERLGVSHATVSLALRNHREFDLYWQGAVVATYLEL